MDQDERVKVYQQIYDLTVSNNKKDKQIERLKKLIITLSKSIQELSCNEEELELLNNILGSDKE